jgi:8-oxo-dGTP pyrophosphatase MutT (NUDIX family)
MRREVLEETGWTLQDAVLLGPLHFQHLTPKPVDHPYAYPHFMQPIYVADADSSGSKPASTIRTSSTPSSCLWQTHSD